VKNVHLGRETMEEAFEEARTAIVAEAPDEVVIRDGDVVRILAEAYIGYEFEGPVGDGRRGPQVERDELFGDNR
jgi:hypothetical protein